MGSQSTLQRQLRRQIKKKNLHTGISKIILVMDFQVIVEAFVSLIF
jgi:hypothetical protein